jgi:UrcA family protein
MNTSNHAHRSSTWLAALAAVSCSVGASQALAAREPSEVPSRKVSYADLNLSTLAGATTLYRRIQQAARSVCGTDDGGRSIGPHLQWRKCYESAIADAIAKVNSPMLTAVHDDKTSGRKGATLLSQRSRSQ